MRIWVNAFIPHTVPGYTQTINQGQNTGKTAVPLPLIARLNPLNTFKPLDTGYLTDQRSFDYDVNASVRTQNLAELSLGSQGWSLSGVGKHRTSGTTEVNMKTGETLGFGRAPMDRSQFYGLSPVAVVPNVPYTQFLYLKAAEADPLVSTAADIDIQAVFQITTWDTPLGAAMHINWTLTLDEFPAFEVYVEHNGTLKTVFTALPMYGKTVEDLPGPARTNYQGATVIP